MLRLILLVMAAVSAQAATISGTVYVREGDMRTPVPGARVSARGGDGGELLQAVDTDAQGCYAFPELPGRRVSLSVSKPGYSTRAAASGERSLLIDASEDVAGADFELLAGGVITGRITDQWGDPLEQVHLALLRVTHFGGRHHTFAGAASTDDRGTYRLFGLEAGRYLLMAVPRPASDSERHPSPVFYPGTTDDSRAVEVEVAAGAETKGIDMILRPEPAFRLSGRVTGLPPDQLARVFLRVESPPKPPRGSRSFGMTPDTEGRFTLPGLPAGPYIISASLRGEPPRLVARQSVDLRGDLADLLLRPGQTGSLAGRVSFSARSGKPAEVRLRAIGPLDNDAATASARAPDYRFSFVELWPGPYKIEVASPPNIYVMKMAPEASGAASDVMVPEGGAARVEVQVGFGLGRVTGVVKAPGGPTPLAHARVGLAKPGSIPLEFRTVQADQRGRFAFTEVRPGEYMLGAWPRLEADALHAPETWKSAGAAVKHFAVEPGAEVEIELTACQRQME